MYKNARNVRFVLCRKNSVISNHHQESKLEVTKAHGVVDKYFLHYRGNGHFGCVFLRSEARDARIFVPFVAFTQKLKEKAKRAERPSENRDNLQIKRNIF